MSISTLCIDANLVIRRVLFPSDTIVQEAWEDWDQEGKHLAAPDLLYYEVTNVLYRYQRQGWMNAETISTALEAALALPIHLEGDAGLHRRARLLAERWNLPAAYDAHYLALADSLGAEFHTSDQRLYHALSSFHLSWVRLVGKSR